MTADRNGNGGDRRDDQSRSAQVDFLRAAAIVAVVVIHVWGPSTEVTRERGPLQAAFFSLFVCGSWWAVPAFFFLSGLLLTQRAEFASWKERLAWLRRRGARLLPPYLFWSGLYLLVAKETDPLAVLRSLLLGTASYQLYFVVALVQAYLLWWLAMPWLSRQPRLWQTVALLGCLAASAIAHVWRAVYLNGVDADEFEWLRATVLPWLGYFAFGCLLALRFRGQGPQDALSGMFSGRPEARRTQLLSRTIIAGVVLVLIATGEATYGGPHRDDPLNAALRFPYAFSVLLVMAALGEWADRWMGEGARRFARALARDSYGIYLCHVLVMQLLGGHVYLQLAGLSLPLELAYRVLGLVVTIGVSWGLVRLLASVPGVRRVSGAE